MKTKWLVAVAATCLLRSGLAIAQGSASRSQPPAIGSTVEQGSNPETRFSAAAQIARLEAVKVRHPRKGDVNFEILIDRAVMPNPTVLTNPDRLVLDFPSTVSACPKDRIRVARDGVLSVRIGVQPVDPPITRVVLDLNQPRGYELKAEGNAVIVTLHAADAQSGSLRNDNPTAPLSSSNPAQGTLQGQSIISAVNTSAVALSTKADLDPSHDAKPPMQESPTEKQANPSQENLIPVPAKSRDAVLPNAKTLPEPKKGAPLDTTGDSPVATNPSANGLPAAQGGNPGEPVAAISDSESKASQNAATEVRTIVDSEKGKPSVDQTSATAASPVPSESEFRDDTTNASGNSSQRAASEKRSTNYTAGGQPATDVPPVQSKGAADAAEFKSAIQSPPDTEIAALSVKLPIVATPDIPITVRTVTKRDLPIRDEYVIGEQDVLSITVWKERELSAVVGVREGKITLPLLNDVKVVGLTPSQLRAMLIEKLKPFVAEPEVTVAVREIHSRYVLLVGEVGRTGAFSLNSPATVLQMLAEAGGLKEFAKSKKIYVLRHESGKQIRFPFNYNEVIKGNHMEQNIPLKPGDMIVVP